MVLEQPLPTYCYAKLVQTQKHVMPYWSLEAWTPLDYHHNHPHWQPTAPTIRWTSISTADHLATFTYSASSNHWFLGDDWAHYSLPLILNTPILCHMWFHLLLFAAVSAGVLNIEREGITDFYISVSYFWLGIFHEIPENPYYLPLNLLKSP